MEVKYVEESLVFYDKENIFSDCTTNIDDRQIKSLKVNQRWRILSSYQFDDPSYIKTLFNKLFPKQKQLGVFVFSIYYIS